eukprot:TRINITY_DN86669_c0_g1_i1.p1 TRINITY_DN86669_c0_g1~~TRINITY_DN86669_c0_g1_i1.p1  ORF type:complete len:193 (-),score=58.62 TRINITY_DN86669_c0_g1_i1:36-566(-)
MGQQSSRGEKAPKCEVPTSAQLKRLKLTSEFWALQADGSAPSPLCLQGYGTAYAQLLEQHCGQHRKEQQRCIQSKKLDPLNMSAWYPQCGEPFELESACAGALLQEVDKRCSSQLAEAAKAVKAAAGNQADQRLLSSLDAVGKCVGKVSKTLKSVTYDEKAAKERFAAGRRLMSRS